MSSLFIKLDPDNARLHSLWHRHANGLCFTVDGRTWHVGASDSRAVEGPVLYGRLGGTDFSIWLGRPDWLTLAAGVLESDSTGVEGLPEPLLLAAMEYFASGALAAVERATGLAAVCERLDLTGSAAPRAACRFTLTDEATGLAAKGAWVLSGKDVEERRAVESALRSLTPIRRPLSPSLCVPGVVRLGTWRMGVADVRGLAVGDIVLTPAGDDYFLVVGRLRYTARFEGGILTVEGKSMTNDENPIESAGNGSTAPLDSVELEMRAVVGRVSVSLAELSRLGVGQVVEFSTPVETPVALEAGGKIIAVGELADVGGRVGVRITGMREE